MPDTPTDAELLTANKAYGDYCEAEGTIPTYRQIFVAGWFAGKQSSPKENKSQENKDE